MTLQMFVQTYFEFPRFSALGAFESLIVLRKKKFERIREDFEAFVGICKN